MDVIWKMWGEKSRLQEQWTEMFDR